MARSPPPSDMYLDLSKFRYLPGKCKPIAVGMTAKLYHGIYITSRGHDRPVCIKQYSSIDSLHVENEYKCYDILRYSGYVPWAYGIRAVECSGVPVKYGLVLDYVAAGNTISKMLKKRRNYPIGTWIEIIAEIAKAVSEVHNLHILINDIKCDNILVDESEAGVRVYLVDFGQATIGSGKTFPRVGVKDRASFSHMAPEAKDGKRTKVESDIYSFGSVVLQICNKISVEPRESKYLDSLRQLGRQCTETSPSDRMALETVTQTLVEIYAYK